MAIIRNKKVRLVVDILLIMGIAYGVRVFMVQTKVVFVRVPYVDDSIKVLTGFVNDPMMQQNLKLRMKRYYYQIVGY